LAPSNFKTYDELKEKLNKVLTGTSVSGTVESYTSKSKSPVETVEVDTSVTDDDDTLDYFAKLAEA